MHGAAFLCACRRRSAAAPKQTFEHRAAFPMVGQGKWTKLPLQIWFICRPRVIRGHIVQHLRSYIIAPVLLLVLGVIRGCNSFGAER